MEKAIVKIQRPITTSRNEEDDYKELLIYDESRNIFDSYTASDEEMAKLFPNDEYKTYWEVKVNHTTKAYNFIRQVGDQNW